MLARFRTFLVVAVVAVTPSFVAAQDMAPRDSAPNTVKTLPAAGPTLENSAVAFRQLAGADSSALEMQRRRQGMDRSVALMVVGGAAILVGAVIGDDPGALFVIGGAVALLYGLYQYLQ